MSAIAAASVGIKTMADGTLRITCDIEPANAQAAFQLFGSPGTPMALAALKVGHAAITSESAEEVKPKGGALAKLAGQWCKDPEFFKWIVATSFPDATWATGDSEAECAANGIRAICEIESRAELDHDAVAAERFHALIRLPYQKHMSAKA